MRYYIEIEMPLKIYKDFSYEGQVSKLAKQAIADKQDSENLKDVHIVDFKQMTDMMRMKDIGVIELEATPMTEDEIYVSRFEKYFLV
jgi:plasmid rolling circle replication initiator protein Rep